MKKPKGIFIYFHHSKAIRKLSYAQKGRLLEALLLFGESGAAPDLSDDPALDVIYEVMAESIKTNFAHYSEVCENRSKAATAREAAKKGEAPADSRQAKPVIRDRFKGKLIEHDSGELIDMWYSKNPEVNI